jgi:hypothetical protein
MIVIGDVWLSYSVSGKLVTPCFFKSLMSCGQLFWGNTLLLDSTAAAAAQHGMIKMKKRIVNVSIVSLPL